MNTIAATPKSFNLAIQQPTIVVLPELNPTDVVVTANNTPVAFTLGGNVVTIPVSDTVLASAMVSIAYNYMGHPYTITYPVTRIATPCQLDAWNLVEVTSVVDDLTNTLVENTDYLVDYSEGLVTILPRATGSLVTITYKYYGYKEADLVSQLMSEVPQFEGFPLPQQYLSALNRALTVANHKLTYRVIRSFYLKAGVLKYDAPYDASKVIALSSYSFKHIGKYIILLNAPSQDEQVDIAYFANFSKNSDNAYIMDDETLTIVMMKAQVHSLTFLSARLSNGAISYNLPGYGQNNTMQAANVRSTAKSIDEQVEELIRIKIGKLCR